MPELGDGIQALTSAWRALQSEAQGYPIPIRIWMGTMAALYFGGIAFTPWWTPARLVVGVMIATFAALVLGKLLWPTLPRASIGAFTHIVLWTPLLIVLLWDQVRARGTGQARVTTFAKIYHAWLYSVIAALAISLVFDARTSFNALLSSNLPHTQAAGIESNKSPTGNT